MGGFYVERKIKERSANALALKLKITYIFTLRPSNSMVWEGFPLWLEEMLLLLAVSRRETPHKTMRFEER